MPPARVHERDVPIHFGGYPFLDIDSIAYELPDGYDVEAVPKPVVIETPFAHYEAGVERQDDGTLVYRRRMELRDVTWPPEQYDAFRAFLRTVARADRQHVVLVEREG